MLFAADFRRIAREALRGKWALAVGTGFVATLLGVGNTGGSGGSSRSTRDNVSGYTDHISGSFEKLAFMIVLWLLMVVVIWAIFTFIIGGAMELGYCRFNKNLIHNTNPRFSDIFSRFSLLGKSLGLRIMVAIFTFLWTLLLIIPGIIASYRYSMVFYIMDDNPEIGIMEAIGRSKEMMIGNKWRLFCLQISFIGWAILCLFTLGIGLLWLSPYCYAAKAAFYLEISGRKTNY